MKYLLIGLGNHGAEYANTRHNIGFDVVDRIADQLSAPWASGRLAQVAHAKHKSRTFVLIKPDTYMNRSGQAARYWLQQEQLGKESMLVILDDLALDFGKLRLRGKGSPGSHNGLRDIDDMTDGGDYPRLRVGIGADFAPGQQVDYVLGRWTPDEQERLPEVLAKAADAALAFGTIGLDHAMNQFNG